MTTIQQLKEHITKLNDEKLLNQFDLYSSFNLQDTKEIIYYKILIVLIKITISTK